MKKLTSFVSENADLRSYPEGDFLIIEIKQNAFEIVTDLTESSHLFDLLALVNNDPEMKGVFLVNHPGCFSEAEYEAYLRKILKIKDEEEVDSLTTHDRKSIRKRQINILNHFILSAFKMQKLIVIGLQGCVVTPFMGASLAADLRFASEDMSFSLAHITFGLHPSGALPYLLPKYVGLSRAKDLLFRGGQIDAKEALKLGLVSEILPTENFPQACIQELKRMPPIDLHLIKITKQLMNIYAGELEHYFEFESKISFF